MRRTDAYREPFKGFFFQGTLFVAVPFTVKGSCTLKRFRQVP